MKVCTSCGEFKDKSEFCIAKTMTVADGLNIYCRSCVKEKKQASRIKKQVEDGDFFKSNFLSMFLLGGLTYKRCSSCKEYCEVSLFSKDKSKRQGYGSSCKYCERVRSVEKNKKKRAYRVLREKMLKETKPEFAMRRRISDQVRKAIKGKGGLSTFDFLPYTPLELKEHLESLFRDGMSWDNYGEWHIDHIKPQSLFNLKKLGDSEFLECWSLKNLQPLWASENCSKGSKFIN